MSQTEHELIGIIYETALDPRLWPLVLDGMAVFLNDTTQPVVSDRIGTASHITKSVTDLSAQTRDMNLTQDETYIPTDTDHALWLASLEQHQLFERLKSHLQRALQLNLQHQHVRQTSEAVTQMLNRLAISVFLVNGEGRLLFANSQAHVLLDHQQVFQFQHGRIQPFDENVTHHFTRQIKALCDADSDVNIKALQIRCPDGQEVSLLLSRFEYAESLPMQSKLAAMILVTPPRQLHTISHAILSSLYGFTPAETQLANLLVHNFTLDEIALQRNVSINTVRNQLGAIFAKTETRRQSELISLLLSAPTVIEIERATATSSGGQQGRYVVASKPNQENQIRLSDNRLLSYAEYGSPDGHPVILCHSMYGCRYEVPPQTSLLASCGIRLIVPDRPGVGLSDPFVFDDYTDWAFDLEQLAVTLKLKHLTVIGHRAGCNFALAAVRQLPHRIPQAILINPAPPMPTLKALKAMSPAHKLVAGLAHVLPSLSIELTSSLYTVAAKDPDKFIDDNLILTELEREVFARPEIRAIFHRCLPELARQGTAGIAQEIQCIIKDWNFPLAEIRQPVTIWYGELNPEIPAELMRKFITSLPNTTVHRLPNEGLTVFYMHWESIIRQLARDIANQHRGVTMAIEE